MTFKRSFKAQGRPLGIHTVGLRSLYEFMSGRERICFVSNELESTTGSEPERLESAPLAYENAAFLDSPDGRSLRILAEYSEPMARFRRERVQDTVVFFGSAR